MILVLELQSIKWDHDSSCICYAMIMIISGIVVGIKFPTENEVGTSKESKLFLTHQLGICPDKFIYHSC